MVKQIIVKMQGQYPFGQCQHSNEGEIRVLVRQVKQINSVSGEQFLQKANRLRQIKHQCLINIEKVLQDDQSIIVNYQYVPVKLSAWISNINQEFIDEYQSSIIKFASFLANNCIGIEFKIQNMGLDQYYSPKYFIGLHYTYQPNINREKLKSYYIKQITNIFRPYQKNNKQKKKVLKSLLSYQSQHNEIPTNFTTTPWKDQNSIESSSNSFSNNQKQINYSNQPENIKKPSSYIATLLNRIRQNKQKTSELSSNKNSIFQNYSQNKSKEQINVQKGKNEYHKKLIKRDGVIRISSSNQSQAEPKAAEIKVSKQTRIQQITNKLNQLKNMVFGGIKQTQSALKKDGQRNQDQEINNLDSSHFAQVLSNIAPQLEDMDADDGLLKEFMDVLEDPQTGAKIFQFNTQKNQDQYHQNRIAKPPTINKNKYFQSEEIIWSAQDDIKQRVTKAIENSQKAITKIKQTK